MVTGTPDTCSDCVNTVSSMRRAIFSPVSGSISSPVKVFDGTEASGTRG